MKLIHVFITLVSTVNTWFPTTTAQDLYPINEDHLDPDAAHVCKSTQAELYTVLISFTEYSSQTTNRWCLHWHLRCTQYRMVASTGYRNENRYRNRLHIFCCIGYKAMDGVNYCIRVDCGDECPEGMWGNCCLNECQCVNDAICNKSTGYCECRAGFSGVNCSEECPEGMWGNGCLNECQCVNDAICNKSTGYCECRAGFSGVTCENCDCNSQGACEANTGECICFDDYQGDNCELDSNGILVTSLNKDDGGTGFSMVYIIVVLCIILLFVIIVIVTYFTRKVRQIKDENLQVLYEANGNEQTTIANDIAGRVNLTYDNNSFGSSEYVEGHCTMLGDTRVDMQETPANGAVSNEEVSIHRLLLDLLDAPSSTASGNIDQNSTKQMKMFPTYDFPKSTCISPNQCSDQDCRQSEGYMNSNIPNLSGNQRDWVVPYASVLADIYPNANGYITPIH